MSEHRKPGIFLSHTWEDKNFVRKLADDLRASGANVWIDEAEIKLGDSLLEKIQEGIDSMDYLAVVLSPEAVASEWVRREVDVAMNQEIAGKTVKVLPLLYRKCDLPSFLVGKLYADFTDPGLYQVSLRLILDRLQLGQASSSREGRPSALSIRSGVPRDSADTGRDLPRDVIEIQGVAITFTQKCGTVVRAVSKPAGQVSLSIKVAGGEIEELTFGYSGPDISRGDKIEVLCGESLTSNGPILMFFLNRSTGESRELVRTDVALFRLGVTNSAFTYLLFLSMGAGIALSISALDYLSDTASLPPDFVSVLLVFAPIFVPFGVGMYLAVRKQHKIHEARSKLEGHLLGIISSFWD